MPDRPAGQQFLLEAADPEDAPAERDLSGHGHTRLDRHAAERGEHGHGERESGRRTVLGHGALGHVDVDVLVGEIEARPP